jgi:hypothetical protein
MRKTSMLLAWTILLPLASLASACSPAQNTDPTVNATATAVPSPPTETFTDPFAYCAAVGTIDQPDSRYTGPKVSDEIINGLIQAAELNTSPEPSDVFKQATIWRCMENKVYACNFGANLPCDSKANTDKTPTQAMTDYCKENNNSDFIPMYVTGHATIYSWRCVKDAPELLDQIDQVDAAGYLARIWYPIELKP